MRTAVTPLTKQTSTTRSVPLAPPMALYEFTTAEEMLRGWQAHSVRQRLLHDESSRSLSRSHYRIGVPAATLTALVGTTAVGGWPIVAGVLGAGATVLVGVQTFLNPGARAESHRLAAMAYKRLIRRMERLPPLDVKLTELATTTHLAEITDLERQLAEADAAAPSPLPKFSDRYTTSRFDVRNTIRTIDSSQSGSAVNRPRDPQESVPSVGLAPAVSSTA